MIIKKRTITTTEDVKVDETTNIGINAAGVMFRIDGENFIEIAPKDALMLYIGAGRKIPAEFATLRNAVAALL